MSRARASSYVHVGADDDGQAVEDLNWDWSRERRQFSAIDTGTPEAPAKLHPLEVEADKQAAATLRAVLGHARLKAERAAVGSLAQTGGTPTSAIVSLNWIASFVPSSRNLNRRTTGQRCRKGRLTWSCEPLKEALDQRFDDRYPFWPHSTQQSHPLIPGGSDIRVATWVGRLAAYLRRNRKRACSCSWAISRV
jgi:hypothetical protein